MQDSHTEVLIIGAGPTGLFTAAELARHGVRPRIIEQSPGPHTQTRATGVQPAALEVLKRAGCVEPFLAEAVRVGGLRVWNADLEEAFVFHAPPPDTPYPATCSIPQWRTEQILNAHLESFGIRVERGVTAREITPLPDGARVTCETQDGGSFVVQADYLIGAGGAHSPVRGAIRQRLEGVTYPRQFLAADARVDMPRGLELLNMIFSPAGLLMVAELPEGRNLLVLDLPDGHKLTSPGAADLEQALAGHLSVPLAVEDVRWVACYKTHRRISPKFREGRCFLAGDAAHLCSPFGGEGMNSGLLDGASLAWQLASVLRRGGLPSLLDAYEPERREAADQVLASSEAMSDFYYSLVDRVRAGQPLEPPSADSEHQGTSTHMLDVAITSSPLLGSHGAGCAAGGIRAGTRFPDRTKLAGPLHHLLLFGDGKADPAFVHRWRDVLEITAGDPICHPARAGVGGAAGCALVRPDGYLGFVATGDGPDALDALDSFLRTQFKPQD
jgi:2-polyprenyl-6-methoxyphenol hydroxylase-like FAD-dependent oxidoreductase